MHAAAAHVRQPRAPRFVEPPGYTRHRPEKTLLYQLVEQHITRATTLRATARKAH